jgi:nucleotide-binding universal stress UspA family protein
METRPTVAVKVPARIVVGLDELGLSNDAARTSLWVADRIGAQVELLHAVPRLPDTWPGLNAAASAERSTEMLDAARRAALAHATQILKSSESTRRSAGEIVRVVEGRPSEVLLSNVRSPADWIALGAHRRAGPFHLGGTQRSVFARASCPIWVQSEPRSRIERILAPIDLSRDSLYALSLAIELARAIRGRVRVMYAHHLVYPWTAGWAEGYAVSPLPDLQAIETAAREQFEAVVSQLDWRGVDHDQVFVEGDPSREIVERSKGHDLVVMGTRGHGGLAAAILGSVALQVLVHTQAPALFVPYRALENLALEEQEGA